MDFTGRCYCGDIHYKASGDPAIKLQCHCRECQYIAGGSANVTIGMPADGFEYTKGTPKQFARADLDSPVVREFCGNCGTQILSMADFALPNIKLIKVGTMDDPSLFKPDMAIFTIDQQSFHHVPDGMPAFERMPG
ncbi:MAG: GFA family protein [Gammaproteobacteria bacterium]